MKLQSVGRAGTTFAISYLKLMGWNQAVPFFFNTRTRLIFYSSLCVPARSVCPRIRPCNYRQYVHQFKSKSTQVSRKTSTNTTARSLQALGDTKWSLQSSIYSKGLLSGGTIFCLILLVICPQLMDHDYIHDPRKSPGQTVRFLREIGYLVRRTWGQLRGKESIHLCEGEFTRFALDYAQPITQTTSIFCLSRPPFNEKDAKLFNKYWQIGIWSVEMKQPDMQISRHYTPLPPCSSLGEDNDAMIRDGSLQLRFLVKKEEGGEVSGWLFRQNGTHRIEMRGPQVEYVLPDDVSEILFLAGGTGVAPAMQVAHAVQQRDSPKMPLGTPHKLRVNMRLVWANRQCPDNSDTNNKVEFGPHSSKAEMPIDQVLMKRVQSLQSAQDRLNLDVDMYCDSDGQIITERALREWISTANKRHAESTSAGKKIIFVSGPDGFLKHLTGELQARSETQLRSAQPPVGGVLSRIKLDGWQVVQL